MLGNSPLVIPFLFSDELLNSDGLVEQSVEFNVCSRNSCRPGEGRERGYGFQILFSFTEGTLKPLYDLLIFHSILG